MKLCLNLLVAFVLLANVVIAQRIYVDPRSGRDVNSGTLQEPVRTINEAAKRANTNITEKTTEIILLEGMHLLNETALFNNHKYTALSRLLIHAATMPDDKEWSPQKMPVILTLSPMVINQFGEEAKGIQVETSHATIEGIRFSGSPDYSYKSEKELRRSYPIWRDGKDLEDLVVSQCLFAGDQDVLPLHVGIIANGNSLVVDHCVFINCKNPVVFWNGENHNSKGNKMRYCLVYGCYFSGVWTTEDTNESDFDFHHNIIAGSKTAWIREPGSKRRYRIHDNIFSGNARLTGYGPGGAQGTDDSSAAFLTMERVESGGTVLIERDQSKRNYLQLVKDSFGSELKAGLFKK